MVRRYDVISGRWSSHFCVWVKIHVFFSISFNNKNKSCKVFIYVLFFMKSTQKKYQLPQRWFKKIKGFQKSFRNTAIYQKLWGEVPSTTPFPLLKCTTVGGTNLCVRPRVDMFLKSNSLSGTHAPYSLCWTHHRKYFGDNGFKILNTALDS